MNIIFVTYYFPPVNSIAAYRVYSFAEHFHRQGHKVLVIAPDWANNNTSVAPPFPVLFTHQADDSVYTDSGRSLKDLVRRELLYKVFAYNKFRDKKPGRFYKMALEKLNEIDLADYDHVVTSYGPLDSLWIGKFIRQKNPGIKWIIDYRDYYSLYYKGFGIFKWYFKNWEKKLVGTASEFITVSETLRANTGRLVGKPGHVVYNGYIDFVIHPDEQFEKMLVETGPYLAYSGSLYHGKRAIRPFLNWYKKNLENKFHLVFALIDPLDHAYVKKELARVGLHGVKVLENLSHNQSLLLTRGAAFPILFTEFDPRSNGFLTGKIYEYIFFKKRVIYSGPTADNELYAMMLKYSWGEHFERFNLDPDLKIEDRNIQLFSRSSQAENLEKYLSIGYKQRQS